MPSVPTYTGSSALLEVKGSPAVKLGEKVTCTQQWTGLYATAWAARAYKGDTNLITLPGSAATLSLTVVDCDVVQTDYGVATLTITSEGAVDDMTLPEDVEACNPERQDLRIEEHTSWADKFTEAVLKDMNNAVASGKSYAEIEADTDWGYLTTDTDFAYVLKLRLRGVNTFAVWTPTLTITSHYFEVPVLTMGGFQETPTPATFTAPDGAWLRAADDVEWNGTFYKVTRKWIGAPSFDEELYPPL